MQQETAKLGWRFGMLWTVASTVGYATGGAAAEVAGLEDWWYPTAAGWALIGCVGAFGQWLIIRAHIPRSLLWVPANAAGWFFGRQAARLCGEFLHGSEMLCVTSFMLPIAVLQWSVLQKKAHRVPWWIIVSGVATWVALFTGLTAGWQIYDDLANLHVAWAGGGAILGLAFGAITAWPLIWILRKRHPRIRPPAGDSQPGTSSQ
jgi:hypothetical protein